LNSPAPSAKEILERLVAFDTTSAKSNLPLVAFVETYLRERGVASTRVTSGDGEKASLFATIGPAEAGGIALSGHTDTVPVEGQSWSTQPFALTRKNGRLYGRGACDMKGFLACALASVPVFQERPLATPIHLAFSYDEEVGCTGVRPMIAEFGISLPRPRAVVVGEPTCMSVVDAHKGIHAFRTRVCGREAHSSMPHLGVNAIAVAAELIATLNRFGEEMRERADGPRFTPPYTSVHVGRVDGGVQRNIVPKHCSFEWEFRNVPATDIAELPRRFAAVAEEHLPAMRKVAPDAAIDTRPASHVPSLDAGGESEAVSLALTLAGANATAAVSYGTEAGLFARAGCPAAVCGPGDIAQAHAPDEFIAEEQLDACMRFLARLAEHARAD
jgi:acetylornithine deacetylase